MTVSKSRCRKKHHLKDTTTEEKMFSALKSAFVIGFALVSTAGHSVTVSEYLKTNKYRLSPKSVATLTATKNKTLLMPLISTALKIANGQLNALYDVQNKAVEENIVAETIYTGPLVQSTRQGSQKTYMFSGSSDSVTFSGGEVLYGFGILPLKINGEDGHVERSVYLDDGVIFFYAL